MRVAANRRTLGSTGRPNVRAEPNSTTAIRSPTACVSRRQMRSYPGGLRAGGGVTFLSSEPSNGHVPPQPYSADTYVLMR